MAKQPKKRIIINILDILRQRTDEEHRLSQADIRQILEKDYGTVTDRKTVKRNLMELVDCGYPLEYSESVRVGKNGEEELLLSDWYLEREFTDAELRVMIDSLLFARHIPRYQCKELVRKIEGLAGPYFKKRSKHISTIPDGAPQNPQLFWTVEALDRAIGTGRQVCFQYHEYGTDKKLHPRRDATGAIRRYTVNPYRMVAANGHYYLVGNYDKYDNVAHYRLDRIKEIAVLEDRPVKPMAQVKGLESGLELPDHLAEHLYMFSGASGPVSFRASKSIMGDIVDWFGSGFRVSDESDTEVTVHLRVNYEAMKYWAMQYACHVRVLAPEGLVEDIRAALLKAYEKYLEENKSSN